MNPTEQLREDLKKKIPSYGAELTLKKLRAGTVKRVYLSSNCPHKEDFLQFSETAEIVELPEDNRAIAVLCKKPFSVAVLSFEA
ncbi:hypothetical protein HZB00_04340 [Candidatus Woesearchaeota archaeon]|nr:hypothetical protein [Candidatus Woesearchaeota archaeon]